MLSGVLINHMYLYVTQSASLQNLNTMKSEKSHSLLLCHVRHWLGGPGPRGSAFSWGLGHRTGAIALFQKTGGPHRKQPLTDGTGGAGERTRFLTLPQQVPTKGAA